jgi:hypothetical protein
MTSSHRKTNAVLVADSPESLMVQMFVKLPVGIIGHFYRFAQGKYRANQGNLE